MNVGIDAHWNHSLENEREAKLAALRRMLDRSIERGGDVSEDKLDAAPDAEEAKLASQGL